MTKKAIIAVSFGTTFPKTREKTIGATERALKKAFPAYDVFRAFTSRIVRARVAKNEGQVFDDPATALDRLSNQGYGEVIVQSFHIIPGIEYGQLKQVVNTYQSKFKKLKLSQPLLDTFDDFQMLTHFMEKQSASLPAGEAILWMGHGTAHSSFTTYACLDHMLAGTKSYVGAVESYPDITDELTRLKHAQIKKVYLQPLMMVAGNHAHNDMASDNPHSWKSIVDANNIDAQPRLKGLGEYPEIQQLFIEKLSKLI